MKKDKYYAIAENMYVEKFITVAEIARRIGVHERTIKRWKKDGDFSGVEPEVYDGFARIVDVTYREW